MKERREEDVAGELAAIAGALLAAAFCLLGLLLLISMPEELTENLLAIAEPFPFDAGAEPSDDPVFIRLASIDGDVAPEIVIRLLKAGGADGLNLAGDEPRILIYHTHDTEAYRPTEDSPYVPSGDFRTEDPEKSVLAVGAELKRILLEEYGINALHAEERHEKPHLAEAYSRSLGTVLRYKELYPSLVMFIDLHRDGVAETGYEDDFVMADGLECARMMFVVGTGTSGKSSQSAPEPKAGEEPPLPDFEANYALALELTESLLSVNGRFMRNIRIKSGNYNQQASPRSLLIEVGHNGNTLEQAKNSMRFLAGAIASLREREDEKAGAYSPGPTYAAEYRIICPYSDPRRRYRAACP